MKRRSAAGAPETSPQRRSATVANAARRSKRARDHLERKRKRERRRREREQRRLERANEIALLRRVATPIAVVLALWLGAVSTAPVLERTFWREIPPAELAILGQRTLSAEQIARIAEIRPESALAEIDPAEIARRVEQEPWVASARVLRAPTGQVLIGVIERNAIARWHPRGDGGPLLVDPAGRGFAGKPALAGPLPQVAGESLDEILPPGALEILGAVDRSEGLRAKREELVLHLPGERTTAAAASEIEGSEEAEDAAGARGFVLELGAGGPRALLGRRLLTERVARLEALLEAGSPALGNAQWIDLRYADRAVLRTDPASG